MSSTKDQRAAARARLEREMAQRAEDARRRRKLRVSIASGLSVLLVAAGTVWLVLALTGDDKGTAQATATCTWNDVAPEEASSVTVDASKPPVNPPKSGTDTMTITTNFGAIDISIDRAKVPCTAASMEFLGNKGFYDGSKCHRMFDGVLQCGDPSARGDGWRETDGTGGPSYRFASENLPPADQHPSYPTGVLAMANTGAPDSTGSQFFFVYKDQDLSPDYTVLGKITKGMDVLTAATKAGFDDAYESSAGGGHPKNDIILQSIRFGGSAASASRTPSAPPNASGSAAPTPSGSTSPAAGGSTSPSTKS